MMHKARRYEKYDIAAYEGRIYQLERQLAQTREKLNFYRAALELITDKPLPDTFHVNQLHPLVRIRVQLNTYKECVGQLMDELLRVSMRAENTDIGKRAREMRDEWRKRLAQWADFSNRYEGIDPHDY